MEWFLYDRDPFHQKVKGKTNLGRKSKLEVICFNFWSFYDMGDTK